MSRSNFVCVLFRERKIEGWRGKGERREERIKVNLCVCVCVCVCVRAHMGVYVCPVETCTCTCMRVCMYLSTAGLVIHPLAGSLHACKASLWVHTTTYSTCTCWCSCVSWPATSYFPGLPPMSQHQKPPLAPLSALLSVLQLSQSNCVGACTCTCTCMWLVYMHVANSENSLERVGKDQSKACILAVILSSRTTSLVENLLN